MAEDSSSDSAETGTNKQFLIGLARAFAGAIIFSFSIVMTMEMWSLGYTIPPHRLMILILFSIPVLIGLSYFVGFMESETFADDVIDAFVGYAVGFFAAAIFLYLFGVIDFTMSYYEITGKITLQTIMAGIGAMFAQSQLGGNGKDDGEDGDDLEEETEEKKKNSGYGGELFLMFIGAVIMAITLAATEEIYLIAFKMTDWQTVLLMIMNIIGMHTFVYKVGFAGEEKFNGESSWSIFARFTIVGYAIALLISCYLLWTFGSLDGLSLKEMIKVTVVLGFPAALGAAASRVII